jgi:hypothetical protein
MTAHFVDIGGIVDRHSCLNFIFITQISYFLYDTILKIYLIKNTSYCLFHSFCMTQCIKNIPD